jgi:glycosyltransferase involved in cell wall biosynthesis
MRVNVIVPCHNASRFLREALESTLAQTHQNTTVLVVDDGSTDETAQIAVSFGERVRSLEQLKSGVSKARNRGLDAVDGEFDRVSRRRRPLASRKALAATGVPRRTSGMRTDSRVRLFCIARYVDVSMT